MQKRASLKDIASQLGISVALVSYVLNGQEKEKRVGAEVAEKIRKIARELNYQPSQVARSLRMGSSMTIGLLIADIANPFFGTLARIIEDEAGKYGYTVLFGSSDENSHKSATLLETLINRQVDGFIIVPCENSQHQIQSLIKRNIPFVLADRNFTDIPSSHVVLDNFEASREATTHLISNGHRRIGILAFKSSLAHVQDRIRGFIGGMKVAGLAGSAFINEINHLHIRDEVEKTIYDLVVKEKKVDALFFSTNSLTIAGLYAIQKFRIKIPSDLAIVGFDGNESFDFFYSPITYVEQPLPEMGIESVRILMDLVKGETKPTQVLLKHQLMIRASSQ